MSKLSSKNGAAVVPKSERRTVLGYLGLGLAYFAGFMMIKMFLYAPIMMALPSSWSNFVFRPSLIVYRLFADTSELTLELGKTCDQAGAQCIPSFNLAGSIQPGDGKVFRDKLSSLLAEHADVNTVCLNSNGGDNDSAAAIAAEIKKRKLNTCVGDMSFSLSGLQPESGVRYTDTCASACTFILLAGTERIAVGARFKLGLHSPRSVLTTEDSVVDDEEAAANGVRFADAKLLGPIFSLYEGNVSVSNEQLQEIFAYVSHTPAFKMYSASVAEQMALGFFTKRLSNQIVELN